MPGEDEELVEGKENPLAEVELPTKVKKAVVRRFLEQQRRTIALREEGHTSVGEVVVEEKELPSSVTGAISGAQVL